MAETARLDKWLWASRIYKTRSIAIDACKNGRVTMNGVRLKASRPIKAGDIIEVRKPPVTPAYRKACRGQTGARNTGKCDGAGAISTFGDEPYQRFRGTCQGIGTTYQEGPPRFGGLYGTGLSARFGRGRRRRFRFQFGRFINARSHLLFFVMRMESLMTVGRDSSARQVRLQSR